MLGLNNHITNRGGAPSWYENTLANLSSIGVPGSMSVSTDTYAIYRDNGTGLDLIGGPGTGTVTGTGVSLQVGYWSGANTMTGDTALTYDPVTGFLSATRFVGSGVGLTGNAPSLTAGNSTLWNGQTYATTAITTAANMLIRDSFDSKWKTASPSDVLSFLGIGGGGGTISGLTTNYVTKATSATTIGDSIIFDTGTVVQIGGTIGVGTSPRLQVSSTNNASDYALALGADGSATQNFIAGVDRNTGLITFKVTALGAVTALSYATNAAPANSALMASGSILGLSSGQYTPTASSLSNVSTVTVQPSGYIRVGDEVTMTGRITLLPSASSTCSLRIDVPIGTTFANFYDAFGVITVDQTALQSASGFIQAVSTTGLLYMQFQNIALTNVNITYSVTYRII